MIKKIVFTTNDGNTVTLNVVNCFAYSYNAEKNVLKVEVLESMHSYAEVAALRNNSSDISFYENDELKSEFNGYTLGDVGFIFNYANGRFSVEVTRKSDVDIKIDALWDAMAEIYDIIAE